MNDTDTTSEKPTKTPKEPKSKEPKVDTKTDTKLPEGAEKVINEVKEGRKGLTSQQKGIAKIIGGVGLAGLVLYFSPYTLAEMASLMAIPLLIAIIVMGLVTGVSVSGNGLLEALGKEDFWIQVQAWLRARRDALKS